MKKQKESVRIGIGMGICMKQFPRIGICKGIGMGVMRDISIGDSYGFFKVIYVKNR